MKNMEDEKHVGEVASVTQKKRRFFLVRTLNETAKQPWLPETAFQQRLSVFRSDERGGAKRHLPGPTQHRTTYIVRRWGAAVIGV